MSRPASGGAIIYTSDDDAEQLARAEMESVATIRREINLAPGVWLLLTVQPFADIATRFADAPPVFVRHIAPIHVVVPLTGDASDAETLADAIVQDGRIAASLAADAPFSVQTRIFGDLPLKPFDINTPLATRLHEMTNAPLDVRAPQQVVSVALVALPAGWARDFAQLRLLPNDFGAYDAPVFGMAGVSATADNLSGWAGGMRRFAREEGQVSRSEFKLLEALELFNINLPPRGVALDLGASPGGWTRILRQREQYVTAVDPGELDERIASQPGVRHIMASAESYLNQGPDEFDIIVNDMRMEARESARLMVSYARFLYPHGVAIMTVKLMDKATPAQQRKVLDETFAILRRAYTIEGARQLFHNRSEVTVALRPLPRTYTHDHETQQI